MALDPFWKEDHRLRTTEELLEREEFARHEEEVRRVRAEEEVRRVRAEMRELKAEMKTQAEVLREAARRAQVRAAECGEELERVRRDLEASRCENLLLQAELTGQRKEAELRTGPVGTVGPVL